MGMSATATVFWGYDLGTLEREDGEDLAPAWMWDGNDRLANWGDADEHIARKLGWVKVPFPDHLFADDTRAVYGRGGASADEYRRWEAERKAHPDYLAWSNSRDEVGRLVSGLKLSCVLDSYGPEEDETRLYVAVEESIVSTQYGCAEFNPHQPGTSRARPRLNRYCKLLDLPPALTIDRPARWHVAAYYG